MHKHPDENAPDGSVQILARAFGRGLVTVLPIVVSIYLLWWFCAAIEKVFGSLIRILMPDAWYLPGFGFAFGVAMILVIGLLVKTWFAKRLGGWADGQLQRIPLVGPLYSSVRDLSEFLAVEHDQKAGRVVMFDPDGSGRNRMLGLLTRRSFDDLPEGVGDKDRVAVYLPMSYQIGGFTTIVPKDSVEAINMSMEDAMRFALTAGVRAEDRDDEGPDPPVGPDDAGDAGP